MQTLFEGQFNLGSPDDLNFHVDQNRFDIVDWRFEKIDLRSIYEVKSYYKTKDINNDKLPVICNTLISCYGGYINVELEYKKPSQSDHNFSSIYTAIDIESIPIGNVNNPNEMELIKDRLAWNKYLKLPNDLLDSIIESIKTSTLHLKKELEKRGDF